LVVLGVGGDEGESAAVEDVEAEVAAAVGPFVVLFDQIWRQTALGTR
jgi:hypothetical protein